MSKRKSYFRKVLDIIEQAKKETIEVMRANNVTEVVFDPVTHPVYIFEETYLKQHIKEVRVTKVILEKDVRGNGYHLLFETENPEGGCWYENRLLWLDIHEAVLSTFNIYRKKFGLRDYDFMV